MSSEAARATPRQCSTRFQAGWLCRPVLPAEYWVSKPRAVPGGAEGRAGGQASAAMRSPWRCPLLTSSDPKALASCTSPATCELSSSRTQKELHKQAPRAAPSDPFRKEPGFAAANASSPGRNRLRPLLSPYENMVLSSSGHLSLVVLECEWTQQGQRADPGGSRMLSTGQSWRTDRLRVAESDPRPTSNGLWGFVQVTCPP